jgi:hypothetical protein
MISTKFSTARAFGFEPADPYFTELVEWLSPYHADLVFRYRRTGSLSLPLAGQAAEIVRAVVDQVEPHVREQHRLWQEKHPAEAMDDLLRSVSRER